MRKYLTDQCLTIFLDDTDKQSEICVMFRHAGCGPVNHGIALSTFFAGIKSTKSNGRMPGLVAATIAFLQTEVSPVSILAAGTRQVNEEFIYYVYSNGINKPVNIKFESAITGGTISDDPAEELQDMIMDVHKVPAFEVHTKCKELT